MNLYFTAPQTGDFHVTARTSEDSGEASIKVLAGNALPNGAARWSGPVYPGCTILQVVPAPPSASGIDVYVSDNCEDGTYLRAFTENGIQKWRHKITAKPTAYAVPLAANHTQTNDRARSGLLCSSPDRLPHFVIAWPLVPDKPNFATCLPPIICRWQKGPRAPDLG